jgi:hypothetical protein
MIRLRIHFLLSFFLLLILESHAQEDLPKTSTSQSLVFTNGVYSSAKEFLKNEPLMPGDFQLLSQKEIEEYVSSRNQPGMYFNIGQYIWLGQFDDKGVFKRIDPDSVWGYVSNGEVFVKHGEYLVPLDLIGSICHFNTGHAMIYKENKPKEYIFRIDEGKIMRFTQDNFLSIISEDMELYQLYLKQEGSFKKMKSSMMDFVLKFNERNPYKPLDE